MPSERVWNAQIKGCTAHTRLLIEPAPMAQEYLNKPYLIDGYKFDLRVYVSVTSCAPLRVYMYGDGLVRLSTEAYRAPTVANLDQARGGESERRVWAKGRGGY